MSFIPEQFSNICKTRIRFSLFVTRGGASSGIGIELKVVVQVEAGYLNNTTPGAPRYTQLVRHVCKNKPRVSGVCIHNARREISKYTPAPLAARETSQEFPRPRICTAEGVNKICTPSRGGYRRSRAHVCVARRKFSTCAREFRGARYGTAALRQGEASPRTPPVSKS